MYKFSAMAAAILPSGAIRSVLIHRALLPKSRLDFGRKTHTTSCVRNSHAVSDNIRERRPSGQGGFAHKRHFCSSASHGRNVLWPDWEHSVHSDSCASQAHTATRPAPQDYRHHAYSWVVALAKRTTAPKKT